jgi:hypothetical protein
MTNDCGELLPDPIPDHPLLNGRVEIGRGENTIVLDGDIVEVEKLYPLPGSGNAAEIATKISTSYFDACRMWRNLAQDMGRIALHHLVVTPTMGWDDAVQQSLKALEVFSNEYGALPDLIKADNLMMRIDGTLVFSDPVFME